MRKGDSDKERTGKHPQLFPWMRSSDLSKSNSFGSSPDLNRVTEDDEDDVALSAPMS